MALAGFKQKPGTRPNGSGSKTPRDQGTALVALYVDHWCILNNMMKLQYIESTEI